MYLNHGSSAVNQHKNTNDGDVSCSRKQQVYNLTPDWHPPIKGQTPSPLGHAVLF